MFKTKWFSDCKTLDELRKKWKKLALQYHPDRNGDTATMQEINNEYDLVSAQLISGNKHFSDNRKDYERAASTNIREVIESIINVPGIKIEIIGSWIWITGDTKPVKETLKEAGFRFSPRKIAWFWHHGKYRPSKKNYSMDDIRSKWGSRTVTDNDKEEKSEKNISRYEKV